MICKVCKSKNVIPMKTDKLYYICLDCKSRFIYTEN